MFRRTLVALGGLLALFHGWLPFLLAYLVWQFGYDKRGFPAWTVLAWVLLLVCFFLMPPREAGAAHRKIEVFDAEGALNDFRRQHQVNLVLFACLESLAIENARMRQELDLLRGSGEVPRGGGARPAR